MRLRLESALNFADLVILFHSRLSVLCVSIQSHITANKANEVMDEWTPSHTSEGSVVGRVLDAWFGFRNI
jgi:hypothetical protein